MRKKLKVIIIIILIIILCPICNASLAEKITNDIDTNSLNTTEINNELELNLYSKSCILVECSTNKIAYEKNSNDKMYPASTTKLLTAIITLENCKLSDTVTITQDMISSIPSGYKLAYLQVGEIVTVEQLLNLLLIPSANDAGYALAIHISGSITEFSKLMNEKALQLGCTNSNFTNPSGIHDENHYSNAKDLALIGINALQFKEITNICSQTSYTFQSQVHNNVFETTNTLLIPEGNSYYEYANGLKTGFTTPAGSCIIATAEKENMKFLAVVLGAPEPTDTIQYRDSDCKTLFEYGFTNYDKLIIINNDLTDFLKNYTTISFNINAIYKILFTCFSIFLFFIIISNASKKKSKNF